MIPSAPDWTGASSESRDTTKRQVVDKTVADLNIAHFRKLLETEIDPAKRQTIERLLAAEEAKLAAALAGKGETPRKT